MVELFKIGSFEIYLFGVTIVLAMLVGMGVILLEAKRKEMNTEKIMDLMLYTLIASFIGARVYYIVAFDLSHYLSNPMEIIAIRNGGLSIQGGIIFGIAFAIFYTKIKNINFWETADVFAPGIIIGQGIGRFGCDVFGIPMEGSYPWGINIGSTLLHPVQLYEAFLNIGLFIFLWQFRDKTKYKGQLFIRYIIGFSIIRGIVEFFRVNPIVFEPFSVVHLTSALLIVIALVIRSIIKDKNLIKEEHSFNDDILNDKIIYSLVVLTVIVGTWVYYSVH